MDRSDEKDIPNPGSDEALDEGCTCAILDNSHGKGVFQNEETFWTSADCPLHGIEFDLLETTE